METKQKQTQKSTATRDKIYEEAIKLFMTKPYDQVKIEEIEANTEKTRGALFYHVKDKLELFEQVVNKYFIGAFNIYEIFGKDILEKDITLLDFINMYTNEEQYKINGHSALGRDKVIDKKTAVKMETAFLGLVFYAGYYLGNDYIEKMNNNFKITKDTWSFFIQKAIEKGEVKPNTNTKLYGAMFTSVFLGQTFTEAFGDGIDFKKIKELFMEIYNKIKV